MAAGGWRSLAELLESRFGGHAEQLHTLGRSRAGVHHTAHISCPSQGSCRSAALIDLHFESGLYPCAMAGRPACDSSASAAKGRGPPALARPARAHPTTCLASLSTHPQKNYPPTPPARPPAGLALAGSPPRPRLTGQWWVQACALIMQGGVGRAAAGPGSGWAGLGTLPALGALGSGHLAAPPASLAWASSAPVSSLSLNFQPPPASRLSNRAQRKHRALLLRREKPLHVSVESRRPHRRRRCSPPPLTEPPPLSAAPAASASGADCGARQQAARDEPAVGDGAGGWVGGRAGG